VRLGPDEEDALGDRLGAPVLDADQHAQHVKLADQAVHIGGSASSESYLQIEKVIAAQKQPAHKPFTLDMAFSLKTNPLRPPYTKLD